MTGFLAHRWALCLAATAATVVVVMAVTLLFARRLGRHSVVDSAWGAGFAVVAVVSFVTSIGHGDLLRRCLLAGLTCGWGLRLAWHVTARNRGQGEDRRYAELLSRAHGDPTWYAARTIYLTQAAVLWFVSMPIQVGSFEEPGVGWLGWLGVAVWLVGFGFEALGDEQLRRFRADPGHRGAVLDRGLWRYTRHPNYFGDACVWWGLYLIAAERWPGMLTILSPLLMTWLLARKTGTPLLERHLAATRPAYAAYVERTSAFVPLPPKRS